MLDDAGTQLPTRRCSFIQQGVTLISCSVVTCGIFDYKFYFPRLAERLYRTFCAFCWYRRSTERQPFRAVFVRYLDFHRDSHRQPRIRSTPFSTTVHGSLRGRYVAISTGVYQWKMECVLWTPPCWFLVSARSVVQSCALRFTYRHCCLEAAVRTPCCLSVSRC